MANYIEKERAILGKLDQTGYAMFGGSREEAFGTLEMSVDSFVKYANTVIRMEAVMPLYYARYEGQELRDKVMGLDSARRSAHESAIANVKMLNRISAKLGLEPFADINTSDRHQVADFAGRYVSELYQGGLHHSMDDLVAANSHTEFPPASAGGMMAGFGEIASGVRELNDAIAQAADAGGYADMAWEDGVEPAQAQPGPSGQVMDDSLTER